MSEKKPYLTLQPSEMTVVQAAATIYAGYITAGSVDGEEDSKPWIQRSVREALRMAQITEISIQADAELD